jgi:uncharacterized protein (TIGR03083 family)
MTARETTAAEREPLAPPAGLRERVLEAARTARAAGRPVPEPAEICPAEAFRRAAGALDRLLGTLGEDDWSTPALRDLDVQCLVGHLIGVEEDVHRCLAGDLEVASADHIESTQPAAERQARRPAAHTHAEWRRAASRTLDLVRGFGDPGAEVGVHGMRLPLGGLLVARAFELWAHDNDIRQATGRPSTEPDASTLRLMTGLAARSLPRGAARTGWRKPVSVHLVLTGPCGGTWDVVLGEGLPGLARVSVIADAAGFCRLVANRVAPADLDLHVTGDPASVAGVLAAAAALALD